MNCSFSEITFPSRDGIHIINAELYAPKDVTPRAIVQLAHGMKDYVARYKSLAAYLTERGYIFVGHHHLGHGKTVEREDDFGFFSESGGVDYLLKDMHTMNRYLRETYPDVPIIILGHSMGSFISRLYVERYPHGISGVIIHGTGGKNPLLPLGKALCSLLIKLKGARHRSSLITNMAFGSYNAKFPKKDGEHAWLTREVSRVSSRDTDKYTNFMFTVSAYRDLFCMISDSNSSEWFKAYPKELNTLIMSGDMDPVGNYGKGVDYVYKQLLLNGCTKVSAKLYPGARHELFNETNREEAFSDIVDFIESVTQKK